MIKPSNHQTFPTTNFQIISSLFFSFLRFSRSHFLLFVRNNSLAASRRWTLWLPTRFVTLWGACCSRDYLEVKGQKTDCGLRNFNAIDGLTSEKESKKENDFKLRHLMNHFFINQHYTFYEKLYKSIFFLLLI